MKNIVVLMLLMIVSCQPSKNYAVEGEAITAEESISVEELIEQVSGQQLPFKVKGKVEEVCQMKGCWMTLQNEKGVNIRVTFKDYSFFVPKDISGREVIIEGVASTVVLEEEKAKHYADDANKEYEPTDRNEISFIAKGVLIDVSSHGGIEIANHQRNLTQ